MIKEIKRITAFLIAGLLILSFVTACKTEETEEETPEPAVTDTQAEQVSSREDESAAVCTCSEPAGTRAPYDAQPPANRSSKTPHDTFVVGTPPMRGDFLTGWSSSEYDLAIKTLTGGYRDTYITDSAGKFLLNGSVVCSLSSGYDHEGNKTHTFILHNYLKWNNGEPITAGDYVAGILAYASQALNACGGYSNTGIGIKGYDEYRRGGDPAYLEGVKLLSEYSFSVTISAQRLPYFWEESLLTFRPVYMAGWFPGNEIISDEYGTRFALPITEDIKLISETERYAPTVTCGPYVFESYENGEAVLRRNEYFGVCADGYVPYFEKIIQKEVISDKDMEMLDNGEIDYISGITIAEADFSGSGEFIKLHDYPRAGYGFIEFALDFGPAEDINVRRAAAHIVDRSIVISTALQGNGVTIDAPYSPAQWTYRERHSQLEQELTTFVSNPARANELLSETQWIYESDGRTLFSPALANIDGDYLRHDNRGNVLRIIIAAGSENIARAIEAAAELNAALTGVEIVVEVIDPATLLDHYYNGKTFDGSKRRWHAFSLAEDFNTVDDKYWSYHSNLADTYLNSNGITDDELDRLTAEMRNLDSTQKDEYADLWVDFQVRWQQILPALPLYTNIYFDAYNNIVTGVPATAFAPYHDVITRIAKFE